MTFSEWSNKKKKKEQDQKKEYASFSDWSNAKYGVETDDIAPVRTTNATVRKTEKDKDEGVFDFLDFDKAAFKDNKLTGDEIAKTILGTVGDAGLELGKGVFSLGEGVVDALRYVGAGLHEFGGDEETAEYYRNLARKDGVGEATKGWDEYLDQYSVLGDTSVSALQGLGYVGGMVATAGLGGAAGLSGVGTSILTSSTIGLSGIGSGTSEAYAEDEDVSDSEAFTHGVATGAAEVVSEMLFGGLGKAANAVGFNKGLLPLDDMAAKAVSKFVKGQKGKNVVEFFVKSGFEGIEEVASGFGQALSKKATYMSEEEFGDILKDENLFEQFVIGSLISGGMQSGVLPGTRNGSLIESNKEGRDFVTGLSQNEQKVIKKEVENRIAEKESKGKKLTKQEKAEIEAAVERDMEKGRISTDTIEEVLGGDSYKAYQEATEKEKAALDELAEIYEGEELEQQVADFLKSSEVSKAKAKLSEDVSGLVRNDKLAESYREIVRRKQQFKAADLTKYNEKERAIVQKAVDSGVLNDSNDAHDLVDFIAKSASGLGLDVDFWNNEKLKKSMFAVEGAKVNGYKHGNTIGVNVQAERALDTTVGHEIGHVLEAEPELYKKLQEVAFDFAKSRKAVNSEKFDNEYKERLYNTRMLYKDKPGYEGVKGFEAIKTEVTADLIGEYLFTDAKFVKQLHTKDRNLFQKIWDEVKYLCKFATAGSEQARKLERLKREFQKVYAEVGQKKNAQNSNGDGVKYRLYNKPNFNKKEWAVVENRKHREFENPDFDIDNDKKWMYVNERGMTLFAVYSKHDPNDPTVLYGTRGKKAEHDFERYVQFVEGVETNVNRGRTAFERLLENIERKKGNKRVVSTSSTRRGTAVGDVPLPFEESGRNGRGDYAGGGEYLRDENLTEVSEEASDNSDASSFYTFSNDYQTIRDYLKEDDGAAKYSLSGIKQDIDALPSEDRKIASDARMRGQYSNSLATMTEDRLTKAYSDYSFRNPTTTKGYMTYIRPLDFLNLTTSNVDEFLKNNTNNLNEGVSEDWGTENNIQESGILYLKVDEEGNVIGHEGRHRMAALHRAGVERVAVIIETPRVDNAKPVAIKKLFGQDFGSTKSYGQVYLHNMLPISKQYERINRYTFGEISEKNYFAEPNIRYSLSDSTGRQLSKEQDVKTMEGGSVTKYSLSTWTPETQAKVQSNLVKAGYDKAKVDKWIKDTNSVAAMIAADKDRLDFEAADNQVMLKDNQEYIKTLDASTLCAKRLVYQGTFDAIQHRMPNTMLSSDDLIALLNIMKEHGVQTPCGVCYVESRRRHLGKFANDWRNSYTGDYVPNLDEVTTSDGLEALRHSQPVAYKDFVDAMNKKGSSNPKVVQLRTEYRNEIMSLTPAQIRKIEAIGGLRVQSFSDFETPHMLDMMQAVMDMSAKGLHSQAYTKVPNFAWVFGDTGIKINLSLIAEGDGFDADGNLAFSSVEGMDINDAMQLRDAYSANVGTIIVGANDKHILACMADDRIDYIIPFHRSGWGMKELDMMGMSSYTDYTYGQKEHDLATGKGLANLYPPDYWDYNLSGKENAERYLNLCAKTGREPKFSQFLVNNGDGTYSLQPDGSTDGYWKTLIDFKMYDNDGNGAAQQIVQPNFNMQEAYRVLNEYEGGANRLPVANDVVEEFVARKQNGTLGSDSTVRFSLSKPVEETKDLMAMHNLQASELIKSLELGGLPMPSIAVVKSSDSHDKYGDVSLILPKESIDPQVNNANKVYGGDAWTPVYPRIEYKANQSVQDKISDKYYELANKIGYDAVRPLYRYAHELESALNSEQGEANLLDWLYKDTKLMQLYLEDSGKGRVENIVKETRTEASDSDKQMNQWFIDKLGEDFIRGFKTPTGENPLTYRKKYIEEHKAEIASAWESFCRDVYQITEEQVQNVMRDTNGAMYMKFMRNALQYLNNGGVTIKTETDYEATDRAIEEKAADGYKEWVDSLFKGAEEKTGIRNDKDPFTSSGNRRSWDALHWENTLENVVKSMLTQDQTGADAFSPASSIFAVAHKRYDSIADIKADSDRLGRVSEDEYKAMEEEYASRLAGIANSIKDTSERNPFVANDQAAQLIVDAVRTQKTKTGMLRYMQKWNKRVTAKTVDDIMTLVNDIANMPTGYFEAKPQRAVSFDEVGVFVIPNNADVKLKQELLNRGYEIAEYDPNIEGHRQQVVNQFEQYKFSLSDASKPNTEYVRGNFYGKDVAYNPSDIAPVVNENSTTEAPAEAVAAPVTIPDDYAPLTEEYEAITPMPEEQPKLVRADKVKQVKSAPESVSVEATNQIVDEKIRNFNAELLRNVQLRAQAAADFDADIAMLQAEYDGLRNKNTMKANNLLRRIERTRRIAANVEADYAKRISNLEGRIENMTKPSYRTAAQRKAKQGQYDKWAADLIGDTSTWADKKLGVQYAVNTLRRNLRDVVRDASGKKDIAKADAIYDELQGKYNHNEALLKRESNKIKAAYADMKITKAEDVYIQMLGELRHNPSTELTADVVNDFYEKNKNNIDKDKVDKAIDMARQTYDSLYDRVNAVLRDQGMKEIDYRKGYFPHFTEDKQGFLAKLFNWKTQKDDIPTDIAGLTEQFNPNRSWQSFNKQRKGDTTDYSFTKGLDAYVHGSLDWIYHIEDIQKRRAFENHIRYVHSEKGVQDRIDAIKANTEYDADEAQAQIELVLGEARNPLNNFVTDFRTGTNTLAGKKSSLDRGVEQWTNRHVYSVMTNLSNRVSANMVGGSVSSALTNFIPITQSWGEVSPISSLRAMGDTIRATFKDDGVVNKSDFLTNRLKPEENLYKSNWDKASEVVGFMMEGIDNFTSQTVWRSKYLENINSGMSENEAIKNADQFAENVIAGRSRGNMPTVFNSKNPIVKLFTAFQLEVNNQYGYMLKDMPADMRNESVAKLAKGYATMFMGAYVYNALYSSLVGRDAAFDPISIIQDLLRDLGFGDDEEEEKEPTDVVMNLAGNIAEELPFVSGLLGGGRVPISAALPYNGEYEGLEGFMTDVQNKDWKSVANELMNPVYYLAMPMGGGQLRKSVQGLGMFSDEHPVAGSYTDSGKLRFPVEDTFLNRLQAGVFGQYSSKNARDYFDNGRSPLTDKQIQEYVDVDMPIQDYWDYREGLKEQDTVAEKFDYINSLDLPVDKKNILINNVVDRKTEVDMTGYDNFEDYEEFDYYTKNPTKYAVAKAVGGYDSYKVYSSELNDIKADKDANGKSISGSRKAKVFDYINNLDADYGEKIILYKSEYKSDDTYNADIVNYLNNRDDITFEEMVSILEELDFIVSADGTISW